MLTPAERVLTACAGAVFVAATVSTTWVQADRLAPAVPRATSELTPATSPPAAEATARPSQPAPPEPPPAPPPLGPIPAPAEPPRTGCPPPGAEGPSTAYVPKPLAPPAVADAELPAPLPVAGKATDMSAVTGKGIWVTNWPTTQLDVPALVARVKGAGLTSVWVRSGGSRQGWYGDTFLPRLVPAAHAAGLKVVAWDFPFLSDPVADAQRAKLALDAGVDAIAPDVETSAEGTHATPQRVELYLSLVRHHAGGRPVAATVPRPTPLRRVSFPYASFAAYADVFVPMVYWSCKEPGELVMESLRFLGQWLPVAPVGQAYDMASEGGRAGIPSEAETWRFVDVAKRGGAIGASLWTIEQVGERQLAALSRYPW